MVSTVRRSPTLNTICSASSTARLDVLGHRVADVGDVTGDADELAQERVLLDDLGVVAALAMDGVLASSEMKMERSPIASSTPERFSSSVTVTASMASPRSMSAWMAPKMCPCAGL